MKRTRITAVLTALSLMISGLPMTSVYAAELPEAAEIAAQEEAEGEEMQTGDSAADDADEKEADSAETELPEEQEKEAQDENDVTDEPQQSDPDETETTDETETADETETTDASEESRTSSEKTAVKELKAAENVKVAGSNGILYDDVAYLSARNVLAMDEEMQGIYRDLCDEVALSKESGLEMQDIVFAVDANGDLYCSYYMPMTALEEIQAEMLPDTDKTLTPEVEEEKENETSDDDNDAEVEEKKDDESSEDGKDAVEEEKKDDESSEADKDAAEEAKKDGETSEDDKNAVEEKKDEATEDDKDAVEEEKKDDETSEDGKDAEASEEEQDAESVEDEQDAAEEGDELFEENLDLIPEMEEETFEEIESVRVENTIDLGYGSSTSEGFGADGIQINSLLPKTNYFESQLTAVQKKYYGYLKGKLLSGSNQVAFTDSRSARFSIVKDMAHATSALILTYPDKTDWMAKPGGFSGKIAYRLGSSTANYTFTYDKSRFYSGSLDSQAGAQVKTLASLAQQYAADHSSGKPVYGVVQYLDQWVCANGYYDTVGTKTLPAYSAAVKDLYKSYYECHSAYGILLKGHGVCESYAKAMSRLLDAVGIPNIYVVGSAGGVGHAWNYVQMPNGNWYLVDSTWNDTTDPAHKTSSGSYLLAANDGKHSADGCHFSNEGKSFTFVTIANSRYSAGGETITLSAKEYNLKPTGKVKLTYKVGGKDLASYGKVPKAWSSSNTKVAKVDQKGNVTAVAPGTADITFSMAGMKAQCKIYVDQIKSVKSAATNKTSESISLGNATQTTQKSKSIELTVNMGNSPHDAAWMIKNDAKTTAPVVTCSKKAGKDVVTVTNPTVTGNSIKFTVAAAAGMDYGSSTVKVKFGGKTATIKVTVGTIITKEMFDITWPAGETAAQTYAYTGKAIRPTVKKKADAAYKPVTFKKSYVNNVNAGTAKLILTGTGKYGGVLEYSFTIKPIDITGADFSKALKSKVYNGGNNPPATVVKLGKKTLKANKDYEILYSGKRYSVVPAGKYTISISGIGNYTGTVSMTQPYEVTTNTIAKVSVAGAGSVKYTGVRIDKNHFKPKIGKNVLPESDYTITWYQGQGKSQSAKAMTTMPVAKGKYTAVIKIKGNNLINTAKKTEIKKNFTIK